jgi:hypothetical protein
MWITGCTAPGFCRAFSPCLGRGKAWRLRGDPDAPQPGEGDAEALQHVPREPREAVILGGEIMRNSYKMGPPR